jgi:hypothetical protein
MYNIASGYIEDGVLYTVFGGQSVTYNGTTYNTGQSFRGVAGVYSFTFSGTGTQLVYELLEFKGAAIHFHENSLDLPVFPDPTVFKGFGIEYMQNANDILYNEITNLNGFAMEILDYPFYGFQITKRIIYPS